MTDLDDGAAASKLQAVILADAIFGVDASPDNDNVPSYGLQPLSKELHQVLCPLNNVPILDYIMEFLASNHIEQVVLITAAKDAQAQHLEDYLLSKQQRNAKKGAAAAKRTSSSLSSFWWSDFGGSNLEVMLLKDSSLLNAGDALRELFKRNIVKTATNKKDKHKPFILVQGNVVANLNLQQAMAAHQLRNQQDASSLLTTVLTTKRRSSSSALSIVPPTTDLSVGLVKEVAASSDQQDNNTATVSDNTNDYRIFYYDTQSSKSKTNVPCSFLLQAQSPAPGDTCSGGLTLRNDLYDTGIYICSPDVLSKFEDEFDYLSIEEDFISNSVDEEEEGLQTRIHAHIIEHLQDSRCYAAKIMDFACYHAISGDLLQRWTYPMVPDSRVLLVAGGDHILQQHGKQQLYKLVVDRAARRLSPQKENVSPPNTTTINKYQYKETRNPSKVGRSSVCQGPGMMGSFGTIGEDCCILHCVFGNDVNVGNHCSIADSHVWNHVVIEDSVTIESSVIAQNVVIRKGAAIPKGCVIGEGCIIGAGVKLQEFTRVTLAPEEVGDDLGCDDHESGFGDEVDYQQRQQSVNDDVVEDDAALTDPTIVGRDGKGHAWHPPPADDDSDSNDSDSENGDDSSHSGLAKDIWIQLQSIGGNPSKYYQWYQRTQVKAALNYDNEDDGFSDDENDDAFVADGLTEAEAFSSFTDGAITFGDGDGGSSIPVMSPTNGTSASAAVVGRQKGVDVVKEMVEICMEFDDNVHPMDNLSIELNSYKFSQNATYSDCTMASTLALLQKMDIAPDMKDGRLVTTLKTKLENFWTALLQKMSIGIAEEVAIIHALEMAATGTSTAVDKKLKSGISEKLQSGMSFRFILQTMHDEEVLSEEAVLKWATERKEEAESQESPSLRVKLFQMQPVQDFLEWLEEESDDDDDDSEEEEEDD